MRVDDHYKNFAILAVSYMMIFAGVELFYWTYCPKFDHSQTHLIPHQSLPLQQDDQHVIPSLHVIQAHTRIRHLLYWKHLKSISGESIIIMIQNDFIDESCGHSMFYFLESSSTLNLPSE